MRAMSSFSPPRLRCYAALPHGSTGIIAPSQLSRMMSTAPGVSARAWPGLERQDLQRADTRPLPEGVSFDELDPAALAKDVHSYGVAKAVWSDILATAAEQSRKQSWRTEDLQEFGIDDFLQRHVLEHASLACGLSVAIGSKLSANAQGGADGRGVDYRAILLSAFKADPDIVDAVACDIQRFKEVDPATGSLLGVYLFYKGVQAVCCARVSHHYFTRRGDAGKLIAFLIQSEMSEVYGVDIHPGCKLGKGITIDHATGVVLGETAEVGDNVYLMHDVTLGATGTSDSHDRHPKIRDGVFLGAKCTVLGNIVVGEGATVAAGAMVTKPVPAFHTAVGMPAKNRPPKEEAPLAMINNAGERVERINKINYAHAK